MTAHAMTGDRERCLQGGMDAYVAKPIQAQILFQTIENLLGCKQEQVPTPKLAPPTNTARFDLTRALERVENDRELLQEMIDLFIADYPQHVEEIREGIAAGDTARIKFAAHTLKGSVGNFAAQAAFDAALRLEKLAGAGNFDEMNEAFRELEDAMQQLRPALEELLPVKVP
jgi:two-component system, sensor histidine kinase and response regulator